MLLWQLADKEGIHCHDTGDKMSPFTLPSNPLSDILHKTHNLRHFGLVVGVASQLWNQVKSYLSVPSLRSVKYCQAATVGSSVMHVVQITIQSTSILAAFQ